MSKPSWLVLSGFLALILAHSLGAEDNDSHSQKDSASAQGFSSNNDGIAVEMMGHTVPPRGEECQLCHTKKKRLFVKKHAQPALEHQGITPAHGKRNMSCNMCHDINNHNYLLWTRTYPADFKNPSYVCARCHVERFRDWRRGIHGKRIGGWNTARIQYHCTDCHQPHLVKFPSMEALPPPYQSPHVIPKEHHQEESKEQNENQEDLDSKKGTG